MKKTLDRQLNVPLAIAVCGVLRTPESNFGVFLAGFEAGARAAAAHTEHYRDYPEISDPFKVARNTINGDILFSFAPAAGHSLLMMYEDFVRSAVERDLALGPGARAFTTKMISLIESGGGNDLVKSDPEGEE